ncbi:MAG: tripartite tricarboxylate transporter substrate binding protein [Betaproteobacteria bacterium]|nr:tripartite tricarboxylate transporter substrate binding protein [Betaproteobacteria bacterium]
MPMPPVVIWIFSVATMVLGAEAVRAQSYPNKPIRIVTAEPGGANDLVARIIAHGISGPLGQQVIVENRGGASGIIAAQTVAKAPPDGYTLLLYASPLWIVPLMRSNMPYEPLSDFSPITWAASAPNILVVHPSLPVKSVKELIALARARPGELNFAIGGFGASPHLAAELFKALTGVNIVRINYRGGGPAVNDLLAGQVQLMFAAAGSVAPHIKSGRLRALAVTSAQPSALYPGLPTVAASGLPGYESASTYGIFAPAGTPATTINLLNLEIVRALNRADVKERLFGSGIETVGSPPEELTARMKSEMARLGKVIKDAGIRTD